MKINEYEAGMLDATLEAFGSGEQLNREQIVELFGDEALATSMVNLLIDAGLVKPAGTVGAGQLPSAIVRDAKALLFLEQGGFTEHYLSATVKPEIEIPHPQKSDDEPFIEDLKNNPRASQPATQERRPEPTLAVKKAVLPEPVASKVEEQMLPKSDQQLNAEALQAEVFKLRKDKMQADHIIRQKDTLIDSLQIKEQQLAKLKLYLAIAVALVLVLVIWLIVHYLKH